MSTGFQSGSMKRMTCQKLIATTGIQHPRQVHPSAGLFFEHHPSRSIFGSDGPPITLQYFINLGTDIDVVVPFTSQRLKRGGDTLDYDPGRPRSSPVPVLAFEGERPLLRDRSDTALPVRHHTSLADTRPSLHALIICKQVRPVADERGHVQHFDPCEEHRIRCHI